LKNKSPTIPSKYQRIITEAAYQNRSPIKVNRAYINAASMAKLRNRSATVMKNDEYSNSSLLSGNNNILPSNDQTSTTGFSLKQGSEIDYKDESRIAKMAIDKYNKSIKKKHAFGSSIKRFDSQQDIKKVFNIDPGPGSYLKMDESEKELLNQESTINSRNPLMTSSNSYSQDGSTYENYSRSPGFGSKEERFSQDFTDRDTHGNPGPGSYHHKSKFKTKGGLINPKPQVSLNFNENNPLNYVRPITVNLYFKQDIPGIGKYNTKKKFGDMKNNI